MPHFKMLTFPGNCDEITKLGLQVPLVRSCFQSILQAQASLPAKKIQKVDFEISADLLQAAIHEERLNLRTRGLVRF